MSDTTPAIRRRVFTLWRKADGSTSVDFAPEDPAAARVARAIDAHEPMRKALDAVQKCFVRHQDGCNCARCQALDKVDAGLRAADGATEDGR